MMHDLREAFREAAYREFAAVPGEHELEYSFSPGFRRKMQRIVRAQAHGYWQFVNTAAKRVIVAAAVIMILLTSAMAIKPIRQCVIKFFVDVYEEYFEVRFGENTKDDIDPTPTPMVRYTLTALSEAYTESNFTESDAFYRTEWEKENAVKYVLIQEPGTQEITLDTNRHTRHLIQRSGIEVYCLRYEDSASYLWKQQGYIFYLSVFEKYPMEEDLELIASLKKAE